MSPDTGHKKRLGRYHVTEHVGAGPSGEVHEAQLDGVGRVLALKRFHDHYIADSLVASRVATAARQYSTLAHPRVARLHAFINTDEHTLAAVELVDGISLDLLFPDAQLPLGAWAKLIVQLGRGVGHAHGRGLCHLGISPSNIICEASGSISITDFGFLAPGFPSRSELALGDRLGYLAPEQLEGKRSSPASDVYSMGIIAYQLFTGTMPHGQLAGSELEEAMLNAPIPTPDIPKPFQKLVARSLARSPFERFSDAGAMADAMEAAMRSVPTPGSLRDIGKFVFEQLGAGYDGTEETVRNFNDVPTVIPGRLPISENIGLLESVPIAPMDASQTRPYPSAIPETIGKELSKASGIPEMELGPAGSGPTGSGQQYIGGAFVPQSMMEDISLQDVADSMSDGEGPHKRSSLARTAAKLASETTEKSDSVALPVIAKTAMSDKDIGKQIVDFPVIEDDCVEDTEALGDDEGPVSVRAAIAKAPDTDEGSPSRTIEELDAPELSEATHETFGLWLKFGLAFVVIGSAGFWAFELQSSDKKNTQPVAASGDAAQVKSVVGDQLVVPADSTAPLVLDAAASPMVDASLLEDNDADTSEISVDGESFLIQSTPEGASVYIDGTLIGKTPVSLDASLDSHKLSLLLSGYNLHTADISGRDTLQVDLTEVTPGGGPGGIKVRCRKKNRYYIFVDGEPTGQLCPSERIGVPKGRHVVEIYDPVTDSRRKFKAHVTGTRASLRVRVD